MAGTYNAATGEVDISKTYEGSHSVRYIGRKVGSEITGTWLLEGERGGTFKLQDVLAAPRPVQPPPQTRSEFLAYPTE